MRSSSSIARCVRLGSLLALGAFGLHQLRYLLSYGPESSRQLSDQGHDYLAGAAPILAGLALAALLATVLGARLGSRLAESSGPRRSLSYALAILAIYAIQELLEGALAAGHPTGPDALLAAAGWVAVPLALLFGALAAALMRGLERIEAVIAAGDPPGRRMRPPRTSGVARAERRLTPLLTPLAFGLARRPPPSPVHAH